MKAWRESASLILAVQHGQKYNHTVSPAIHDYNLLFLKRHQKSKSFPGSYVFPGGTVDPADSDKKWHDFFVSFGFDNGSFAPLIPKDAVRPPIFRSRENELPKEISLRITAIRETFEECGVLICKHKKDSRTFSNWAQCMPISKDELQTWQNKVHNNATEFFTLCEKLECYPDLWALYEWNNWLTPTTFGPINRFDTIFYLACMPSIPYAEYETSEIEELKWVTPEGFFSSSMDIQIVPPQHYEMTMLNEIKSIDTLLEVAIERNKEGVHLYFPVRARLKDGIVLILPKDTMYPDKVSFFEKQIIDKSNFTMDEFRKITPIKNRIEFHGSQLKSVFSDNVRNKNGHTVVQAIHEKPEMKNKF